MEILLHTGSVVCSKFFVWEGEGIEDMILLSSFKGVHILSQNRNCLL